MASSVIDPVAVGIAATATAITGLTGGVTVKGRKWAPNSGDVEPPAAVVYPPSIRRVAVGPDIPEDHLGFRDWHLDFPVHLYFGADDREFAQAQCVEVLEAFIKAIDASMDATKPLNAPAGLTGELGDVKLTEAEEPTNSTLTAKTRPLWEVRTRVEAIVFVP